MNEILERIDTIRNAYGWTMYKLAKESDIPYSSLSSLYKKNNHPTISTLEKICDAFNISLSAFFSLENADDLSDEIYTKDERALIDTYRKIPPREQQLLRGFINLLLTPPHCSSAPPS